MCNAFIWFSSIFIVWYTYIGRTLDRDKQTLLIITMKYQAVFIFTMYIENSASRSFGLTAHLIRIDRLLLLSIRSTHFGQLPTSWDVLSLTFGSF